MTTSSIFMDGEIKLQQVYPSGGGLDNAEKAVGIWWYALAAILNFLVSHELSRQ